MIPQTLNGHKFRRRTPKDVVDELQYIKENFEDLGEVFFEDDTFTASHEHVREICNLILERKLKITWSCNARADVPLDLLKLMKKAGGREMCVGFESASPVVLENIHKGVKNTDKAIEFTKNARKAGLLVHGCFMVGNPGDTPETLRMTLAAHYRQRITTSGWTRTGSTAPPSSVANSPARRSLTSATRPAASSTCVRATFCVRESWPSRTRANATAYSAVSARS